MAVAGIAALFAVVALGIYGYLRDRDSGGRQEEGPVATPVPEKADTGFIVAGPEHYDSADTCLLVDQDQQAGTLTFLNLELGRRYTLSVDGTTRFADKYGDGLTLAQLELGDIVDITFLKTQKHLTTLQLSSQSWTYTQVERYEINTLRGWVSIGAEVYRLTSNTQYLSEGRHIEEMDLNPSDILTFQGIGKQVLSIKVDKGHGYLRLENDANFVGGWIEIGQTLIQRISEDMLLLVPEGSYQVNISHRGGGGTKEVVIHRNEEVTLDIGDLEVPAPQYGMVLFSMDPAKAELYIDGTRVDTSGPVSLEYGLHQMIARAEGYQSVTQYIRVGQESAGINVVLDANRTEDVGTTGTDSSSTDATDTTSGYYKIYVDAPEGVEVYLDGNYMGVTPCNFKKTAGTHVITLRKTGYTTRSYTVQVDEEAKDISYSFADLVAGESSITDALLNGMWDSVLQ